ncbi:uncharacterized protein LOC128093758 [Culex pipiens pallens]|uniref:uncharacterized protein LOC128093758 n=1 Tax=Culex pipiens pallens TaxID=42434 RepID=UPI0022AA097C|nr:uncharacterized protein LOC128093758 [Culex pipiens pallens]
MRPPSQDYVRYVSGFRGSRKLKVGQYSYTKNKECHNKTYWSCARAGVSKCKARVLTYTIENGEENLVVHFISVGANVDGEGEVLEPPKDIFFVIGQRGCVLLHVDGFRFVKNRVSKIKTYWICAKKGSTSCKARVITGNVEDDEKHPTLISRSGKHNHEVKVQRKVRTSAQEIFIIREADK